jgi:hypothetical protein
MLFKGLEARHKICSHAAARRERVRLRLMFHAESSFTLISYQLVSVCVQPRNYTPV